jgi:hypothetical protein
MIFGQAQEVATKFLDNTPYSSPPPLQPHLFNCLHDSDVTSACHSSQHRLGCPGPLMGCQEKLPPCATGFSVPIRSDNLLARLTGTLYFECPRLRITVWT